MLRLVLEVVGAVVVLAVVIFLLTALPDLARYLKIRSM